MPQLPSSLWVKKEGQSHPLKALNKKAVPTPNPGSRVCKSSIVYICISLISFDCCEIKKKKNRSQQPLVDLMGPHGGLFCSC